MVKGPTIGSYFLITLYIHTYIYITVASISPHVDTFKLMVVKKNPLNLYLQRQLKLCTCKSNVVHIPVILLAS